MTREQHPSIHQHDALVEVGGFTVDAVDFLQQAATGEGDLGEAAADEDGDVLGLEHEAGEEADAQLALADVVVA